jgi:hypothetical protein
VPEGWEDATKKFGLLTVSEMPQQTQDDVATVMGLVDDPSYVPCIPNASGTLKCEVGGRF